MIGAHGGLVAPGFNDSHVHFIDGGFSLGKVDLAGATSLDQIQDRIRAFSTANADAAWVEGHGWLYSPFPGGSPTKEQLDAVVPDRPAVMACYDGHSIWVNSKALAIAGVTSDTPNPTNGIVVKDGKTGEPTGHLAYAHRFGVTSVQDAGVDPEETTLYVQARQTGELHVRTYLAFTVSRDTSDLRRICQPTS